MYTVYSSKRHLKIINGKNEVNLGDMGWFQWGSDMVRIEHISMSVFLAMSCGRRISVSASWDGSASWRCEFKNDPSAETVRVSCGVNAYSDQFWGFSDWALSDSFAVKVCAYGCSCGFLL